MISWRTELTNVDVPQMFFVGAHIISVYSGMPFRDFVHERIFTPLNMSSTTYHGQEAEESGWFSQAWSGEGRRIPYWMQDESVSEWVAGAGGVISNTLDMVGFRSCQS